MRKFFAFAGVTAVALGAPLLAASSAAAVQPLISVGEGACVAPWWWEGPGNVADNAQKYRACDGTTGVDNDKQGVLLAALDGSCLAPWHWQGPVDLIDGILGDPDAISNYTACNGSHGDMDHQADQGH
jgi:hypothetical protein